MQTLSPIQTRGRLGPILIVFGAAVLLVALALYVSGTSRAVAVWMTPVGLVALAMGIGGIRGMTIPRWGIAVLAAVVVVLAALGIATLIYSAAHPPSGGVPETQRPTP